MIIYAVDDEPLQLDALNEAIREAEPGVELYSFNRAKSLLEALKRGSPPPHVAFLDVEMPGMSGLELAQHIKMISPRTWIVFVTSYSQYAVEAFRLRVKGFVVKPITAEMIRAELDAPIPQSLPRADANRIRVQTFGNFEVFVDGQPLKFSRSKAKELFAYLVHRQGATCTAREVAAILFEGEPYGKKQLDYLQKLTRAMRKAFTAADAADILNLDYDQYAVYADKVDCDYYRFIGKLDLEVFNTYTGEYMTQYSWAELTAAYLDRRL